MSPALVTKELFVIQGTATVKCWFRGTLQCSSTACGYTGNRDLRIGPSEDPLGSSTSHTFELCQL